jgi:hypothetical protein
MTESSQATRPSRTHVEKASIQSETTADGRYIPHTGGLMGWFENSGVLKCEQPNNYKFHEMIDADSVRKKLFERWGGGETSNRRVSTRHDLQSPINVGLSIGGETSFLSTAKDYSSHGLRLQLMDGDKFSLEKGDAVNVLIYEDAEGKTKLFEIPSQIMWVSQVGRTRPTVSVGIAFMEIQHDERQKLTQFFQD